MQAVKNDESKKHNHFWLFFLSLLLHLFVLSIFIISFEFDAKPFVLENADKKTDTISAYAMSMPPEKIIQQPKKPLAPPKPVNPEPIKPVPLVKQEKIIPKKPAIIIPDKKKLAKEKKARQKELEKALAKELKSQSEKLLRQELMHEEKRMAGLAAAQKTQGEVDKYKALILQAISQHWLVPSGTRKNLYSELLIRVAPGGVVLDVQLVKSSGNEGFDRSARAAVFKASPLPVPRDSAAFDPFRQFVLKVKPLNLLTNQVL